MNWVLGESSRGAPVSLSGRLPLPERLFRGHLSRRSVFWGLTGWGRGYWSRFHLGIPCIALFPSPSRSPGLTSSTSQTKTLPTHCPGTRRDSGTSFHPAWSAWSGLSFMEGLTLPSGSRATTAFHPATGNGFIFWSGLGSPRQRRCPSCSFCLSSPPIPKDRGPGRLGLLPCCSRGFP